MEHYSPRDKAKGGDTTGFNRSDPVLRAQQKAANFSSSFEKRREAAQIRNQLYQQKIDSGEYQKQQLELQRQKREYDLNIARAKFEMTETDFESGGLVGHLRGTESYKRANQLVNARAKHQLLTEDISSGRYAEHQGAIGQLDYQSRQAEAAEQRRLDRERWMQRGAHGDELAPLQHQLDQLKRGIEDGTWQAVQKLNKQLADTRRQAEYASKYGTQLGGFLARHEEKLQLAGLAMGAAAWTIRGRAQAGFQGTLEQNRADLADTRLNREVAAIFKPVKEAGTDLKNYAAEQLQGMSGRQQNMALALALGLGAYGTVSTAGTLWGLGRRFLGYGAGAGAAGAAGAAGGAGAAGAAGGAEAAAAAGIGAAGAGGAEAAAAGGATGLGARFMRFGGKALRFAGKVAPWVMAADIANTAYLSDDNYYSMHRRAGHSKVGSGFAAALDSATESALWFVGGGEDFHAKRMKEAGYSEAEIKRYKEGDKGHRRVTPADTGFEDIEESYDRLQAAASMVDTWQPKPRAESGAADTMAKAAFEFAKAVDYFKEGGSGLRFTPTAPRPDAG